MIAAVRTCLCIPLVLASTGCVSKLEPHEAVRTMASSGSLVGAMAGAGSIAMHPNARIVQASDARNSNLRGLMDDAVAREFAARGYSLANPGRGERVIAYAIGVTGEMRDAELAELFGISPGVDTPTGAERGGIVLVVLDQQARRVLWRASGSGPVDPGADPAENREKIRAAIDRLLSELPKRR